ncbi:cytochrome c oxidase subunit 2 [Litorimonas cladophorae]|uniref:Cytochrome c oxidase subunit 2 n=1 Tax=Litorimonas cladophorae TaxID=1220491 RepID=A0A918KK00_9PROT|nr:cytochrome c oxidase subunit II [Litorimonas cladophorae]GGX64545.1 cytochrome c oxidase subunit 2 [Litorimonas cladophorae]
MKSPRNNTTIIAAVLAVLIALVTFIGLVTIGLGGERGMGMPADGGYFLQDAATPVMEDLTTVHNMVFYWISGITAFVMALMVFIMIRFREKANPVPSKTTHNTAIEVVWTIAPVLILLFIAVPSMQLLYFQDKLPETEMTVKAVGNTWNWSYTYPDLENIDEIISNPLDEIQAKAQGKPFLLGTDAQLVVPVDTNVKVLVTSINNMHSWTVPSFGIKMDAVPGIINETWFRATREGVFYGQCSEICGIKHYYMPIEVNVVSKAEYARWVANDGAFTTSVAQINTDNTLIGSGQTAAQK